MRRKRGKERAHDAQFFQKLEATSKLEVQLNEVLHAQHSSETYHRLQSLLQEQVRAAGVALLAALCVGVVVCCLPNSSSPSLSTWRKTTHACSHMSLYRPSLQLPLSCRGAVRRLVCRWR